MEDVGSIALGSAMALFSSREIEPEGFKEFI